MIVVPVLSYAAIIEAAENTRARSAPVRRENRFPHREHYHRVCWVILQNLLDRG